MEVNLKLLLIFMALANGRRLVPDPAWYSIRLAGGSSPYIGRVEVKVNNTWGTICDDEWSLYDGEVACRQLGFDRAKEVFTKARFGEGSGPILHDDMECENTENSMAECPGTHGSSDCSHAEDAGLECIPPETKYVVSECRSNQFLCPKLNLCIPARWLCDGDNDCDDLADEDEILCGTANNISDARPIIRLAGGNHPTEGRVELHIAEQWGSICDDSFDDRAAEVVCRQLGYSGSRGWRGGAIFGPGSGPVWIDDLHCLGDEEQIIACQRNPFGVTDCNHSEDVSVYCADNITHVGTEKPSTRTPENKGCGHATVRPRPSSQYDGPVEAIKGSWPWIASLRLRYRSGFSAHRCGGILINARWIVTAADCFDSFPHPWYWKVRLGEHNEMVWEHTEHDYRVVKVVVHHGYNGSVRVNNIALVEINQPVELGEYVRPICLPDDNEEFGFRDRCFVAGWGRATGVDEHSILNQVRVPIISEMDCESWYGERMRNHTLCGGFEWGGPECEGDHTAPFMCYRAGAWNLVGIMTPGKGCSGRQHPGIFTAVPYFNSWIQTQMNTTQSDRTSV